jgi:hypothetical protein
VIILQRETGGWWTCTMARVDGKDGCGAVSKMFMSLTISSLGLILLLTTLIRCVNFL